MPTINLDDIKIWAENYNEGDIGSIALSIRRFGYGGAVKLWKDNECRGGNHTVMALRLIKELGPDDEYDQQWPPTNVMVEGDDWHILYSDMSHLSEAEALAYAISDNRQAERASKDEGLLLEYLESLRDEDMTLVVASGFDDGDMEQIAEFLGEQYHKAREEPFDASELNGASAGGDIKATYLIYLSFETEDNFYRALKKLTYGERNEKREGMLYASVRGEAYVDRWEDDLET